MVAEHGIIGSELPPPTSYADSIFHGFGREGLHLSLLSPPTRKDVPAKVRPSNEGSEDGLETEKEYKAFFGHAGHGAYATMVSGIAQWQASVLAINHGLPHCSPVNHRTRGTRELPSVK